MNIHQALVVLRSLYHQSGHAAPFLSQQERAALLQLIQFADHELDRREEAAREANARPERPAASREACSTQGGRTPELEGARPPAPTEAPEAAGGGHRR